MAHRPTRRRFLATAAAAAGGLALPACRSTRAARPLAEKLRLGVIGVGGRGWDNFSGVLGEDVVAICDVDQNNLAAAAAKVPAAQKFADFRRLLELPGLDAVVVSTPDHVHYPAAGMALQRGLDVYCEKPLTHTVAQARRLRAMADRTGAVTQMGTQIHANANYRRVVEAVRSGAIGTVGEVWVFVNGTDWSTAGAPPAKAVPAHLDWPLWLGPAADCAYSDAYHPAGWRRYWAFGGGTTADMGCHFMDLAFWALDLDAPERLQADGPEPDAIGAPRGMHCTYRFPAARGRGPVTVHWHSGNDKPEAALRERGLQWVNGVLFVGDKGWLIANYDKFELGPKDAFAQWQAPPQSIPASPGHHAEWIQACKTRVQPTCWFGYAGPLTETVLLANVAYRAARGRPLLWDAAAMRLDDAGAQALLDEPARAGFAV